MTSGSRGLAGVEVTKATRARSKSKALTAKHPTHDEQREIFFGLVNAPDMNAAITGAAYVERGLEGLLRDAFIELSTEDDARMFDGRRGAILGGLAAKIRVAYAIGLLGPTAYSDLLLVNDIRNTFAHSLHNIDFSHPDITNDCALLHLIDLEPPDEIFLMDELNSARIRYIRSVVALYVGLLSKQTAFVIRSHQKPLARAILRGLRDDLP